MLPVWLNTSPFLHKLQNYCLSPRIPSRKKVTILHVQNFVTWNSWKHVQFAVILVGTPFKNHLVFGSCPTFSISIYKDYTSFWRWALALSSGMGLKGNSYWFGAHPVGLPSLSFSVNALLQCKTYRVFTKQSKDNNNRDISKIWKWEISKKVIKFLLYNIQPLTFEVPTVVYMKNMVFSNVTMQFDIYQTTYIPKDCNLWNAFHLLTPWGRVLHEKLTGSQQVEKFPMYRTRRFITTFTSVGQLFQSWARPIQPMPLHPTLLRSIIILSSHLSLGLPSGLFPSCFPTKTLYTPFLTTIPATYLTHLIPLKLIAQKNLVSNTYH